ncbi:MAG: LysR family transcriptional regulator [Pigmentiphaga sp.]|uniref:LysR family transcriptional regulator n=1 Tax=Pigmentiphaga sp. TaxID=1977564 RepID=UPI0029AF68DA|nr:LysR family transcriptional regulator [Pigmentiphaga sp.]MDX3906133.1 LysR family transcriptional regulator [Pigmentiphaga sp.]
MDKPLSRQLDLNLLDLFDAIYRSRNLTAAGKALGLSQPAMSHALARLRDMYGDPLFVRLAKGVAPTPFADELIGPVSQALQILGQTLEKGSFVPETARRVFRLAMTDIGEHTFMPRLIRHLQRHAPRLCVETVATSASPEDLAQELSKGSIDLALGAINPDIAGVSSHTLFSDVYACVARPSAVPRGTLSLAEFKRARHVVPAVAGTNHAVLIDRMLAANGMSGQVVARVTHFLAIAELVANTDVIAIMPRNLALSVAARWGLCHFSPPVQMPGYDVMVYWHKRYDHEPGNAWLRQAIVALFQGGPAAAGNEALKPAPRKPAGPRSSPAGRAPAPRSRDRPPT